MPALAALVVLAACGEAPTEPGAMAPGDVVLSSHEASQTFASGTHVTTWDAIPETYQPSDWAPVYCTATPAVGLDADWQNPHNAFEVSHPWANDYFVAPWINAWNHRESYGSGGTSPYYNWTKYSTEVSGDGTFVIRLLADNCSWIYLDGTLVGVQGTDLSANSYGLTLSGTHTLEFIIFDGGGAAGGKFLLETTSDPPPSLNDDLDDDGHLNDDDAFPLDPTEWADSDGDGVGDNADAFPEDPSEWADSDGDGVGDNADEFPDDPTRWTADSDGDGVGDDQDAFPDSDTGGSVVIGGCDSGVTNQHLGNGAWFNDLIGAAQASARNHGTFVRAVSDLADGWKKAGLITGREQGAIVSCAARSK